MRFDIDSNGHSFFTNHCFFNGTTMNISICLMNKIEGKLVDQTYYVFQIH